MKNINAYAKLLRLPGLGAMAIPPVFGAISVGMYDFYHLALLFAIGAFSVIFGFVLNDYADIELDKLVKELHGKPLISGDISPKNAIAISFFCIPLTFFFIFLLWYGETLDDLKFVALACMVIAYISATIYNLYGKQIVGSDFFVAISMAFVFLFGALSFGTPTLLTWVIFILTFNQTLHMNAVEGGIKDADHDFSMGVKNIALLSGVKVDNGNIFIPFGFKAFGIGIRLFSSFLVFVPFAFYTADYQPWHIIIMALFVFGVLYLSVKLLILKMFDRAVIRKLIASQAFLRYSLVPVMLIPFIGLPYSIVLIVFPFAWYVIFTPIIGEQLFRPRM